jgi:N-acylglucosamine 2-epimerase
MKQGYSIREFIKQGSLIGLGAVSGLMNAGAPAETDPQPIDSELADTGEIGGITLRQLREQYRTALFKRFLPSMDSLVIDHQYGGFMCDYDMDLRTRLSANKQTWSEGRGIWVYSFLYNHFGKNPHFLEVACKSKDFILKHQPPENKFWISSFTREGTPVSGPGDIYGNLYLAEGLTEFAKASGEKEYLEMAKKILLEAMACYDREDYRFPLSYGPSGSPKISAPRVLGHWMVFLWSATQFLEQGTDPEIERLAGRCVDAILKHHLNHEYGLLNEGLNHDLSLPANEWAQFSYFAIGIQTLWMLMFEAIRTRDAGLFRATGEIFKKHLLVATDPVYGGYFRSLDNVSRYAYKVDKVLSLQEEVLIGTLLLIEHTQDSFARDHFAQTYAYVREKFMHPEYAFVVESGNRKLTDYSKKGVGNYHHPRHLMLNLLALERMIGRGGKASDLFG